MVYGRRVDIALAIATMLPTRSNTLLHGKRSMVFGDSRYQGAEKLTQTTDVDWLAALGSFMRMPLDLDSPCGEVLDQTEQIKASV